MLVPVVGTNAGTLELVLLSKDRGPCLENGNEPFSEEGVRSPTRKRDGVGKGQESAVPGLARQRLSSTWGEQEWPGEAAGESPQSG